ncbi:DUF3800 domain-containing protein [Amycolatopsis sp. NBRC 101858]|uniref:DUF3800 domain-containing protein n=1 Tax=Amycolatopsis sp. NBRC 101858 TaxID=3032200 RepID=UPI002553BD84|nr:DUF3800 domain-containing protein [Amycolatopsis sp. NBRC 101858]
MTDDSEQLNPSRPGLGHLIGLGAVLFPEDTVALYSNRIKAAREELKVPPTAEIKWSPKGGSWFKTDEGRAIRAELQRRMIDAAVEAGARSVSVVWDRGRVEWEVPQVRATVLGFLYDKVSNFLKSQDPPGRGIVVADEPGGNSAEQHAWLAETLPLTTQGTKYNAPTQVVMPILMAPSHHVPQLQLADLVAGVTVGAVAGSPYATSLLPRLLHIASRDKYGRVGGTGITLWPPDLANLYWHLCGDTTRWNQGCEYNLPHPGWDYHANAGIPAA